MLGLSADRCVQKRTWCGASRDGPRVAQRRRLALIGAQLCTPTGRSAGGTNEDWTAAVDGSRWAVDTKKGSKRERTKNMCAVKYETKQ